MFPRRKQGKKRRLQRSELIDILYRVHINKHPYAAIAEAFKITSSYISKLVRKANQRGGILERLQSKESLNEKKINSIEDAVQAILEKEGAVKSTK